MPPFFSFPRLSALGLGLALSCALIAPAKANVFLQSGFETADVRYGFNIVNGFNHWQETTIKRFGNGALGVKIDSLDSASGQNWQEVGQWQVGGMNTELWYGFSVYIPSTTPADANYTILHQLHILPDVGEPPLSPPIDLLLGKNSKGTEVLAIDVKWDTVPLTTYVEGGVAFTNGVKNIHQAYYENNPKRDTWNDFVFHVRLAPDNTGFLEVWKNGVKLNLTDRTGDNNGVYNGPTTYNQAPSINHNLRFGLYKRNYETVNLGKPFVLYYDSIRVSNTMGSAGYNEVVPR
jgi:hypothetical protein